MTQLLVLAALVVVVGAVSLVLTRRAASTSSSGKGRAAPVRTGSTVPDRVARADFDRPEAPWLVVSFSSTSCLGCQGTWTKVAALESAAVAVQDVPFQTARPLHERYRIDAVPVVVIADAEGTVRSSFVGPPSAADLWASLAELRSPGSVPGGCDHHGSVR